MVEIAPEGMGGNDGVYRVEEMKSLKVVAPGSTNSALEIVLGIVAVAALVALLANSDSVKICSPSPCPEE